MLLFSVFQWVYLFKYQCGVPERPHVTGLMLANSFWSVLVCSKTKRSTRNLLFFSSPWTFVYYTYAIYLQPEERKSPIRTDIQAILLDRCHQSHIAVRVPNIQVESGILKLQLIFRLLRSVPRFLFVLGGGVGSFWNILAELLLLSTLPSSVNSWLGNLLRFWGLTWEGRVWGRDGD